jgi:crotonobetainyl-CoA:carnitine CoA-transferase CaiB-like acyl-CoA transferase
MKRLALAFLLAVAVLSLATMPAYGDDDHHRSVSGVEMGAFGAVAASAIGAVVYLVRRRRTGSGQ